MEQPRTLCRAILLASKHSNSLFFFSSALPRICNVLEFEPLMRFMNRCAWCQAMLRRPCGCDFRQGLHVLKPHGYSIRWSRSGEASNLSSPFFTFRLCTLFLLFRFVFAVFFWRIIPAASCAQSSARTPRPVAMVGLWIRFLPEIAAARIVSCSAFCLQT